jgi:hypothetical protein
MNLILEHNIVVLKERKGKEREVKVVCQRFTREGEFRDPNDQASQPADLNRSSGFYSGDYLYVACCLTNAHLLLPCEASLYFMITDFISSGSGFIIIALFSSAQLLCSAGLPLTIISASSFEG